MKLIFVRHGDPCRESYSLNQKGAEESRLLGKFFRGQSIKKIISSKSLRAKETTNFFLENFVNNGSFIDVESVDWLGEFKHKIILLDKTEQFPWEMPLDAWCNNDGMLNLATCMDNPVYESGNIKLEATKIWNELDKFLSESGYSRNEHYYNATVAGNRDTFIFISHFATISVLLSHLLNIPLAVMLHFFWQAPSAFTTLRSEESERGKVIFRCIGYNETPHLIYREDLKSFYGLKPELFDEAWRD